MSHSPVGGPLSSGPTHVPPHHLSGAGAPPPPASLPSVDVIEDGAPEDGCCAWFKQEHPILHYLVTGLAAIVLGIFHFVKNIFFEDSASASVASPTTTSEKKKSSPFELDWFPVTKTFSRETRELLNARQISTQHFQAALGALHIEITAQFEEDLAAALEQGNEETLQSFYPNYRECQGAAFTPEEGPEGEVSLAIKKFLEQNQPGTRKLNKTHLKAIQDRPVPRAPTSISLFQFEAYLIELQEAGMLPAFTNDGKPLSAQQVIARFHTQLECLSDPHKKVYDHTEVVEGVQIKNEMSIALKAEAVNYLRHVIAYFRAQKELIESCIKFDQPAKAEKLQKQYLDDLQAAVRDLGESFFHCMRMLVPVLDLLYNKYVFHDPLWKEVKEIPHQVQVVLQERRRAILEQACVDPKDPESAEAVSFARLTYGPIFGVPKGIFDKMDQASKTGAHVKDRNQLKPKIETAFKTEYTIPKMICLLREKVHSGEENQAELKGNDFTEWLKQNLPFTLDTYQFELVDSEYRWRPEVFFYLLKKAGAVD